MCTAVVNTATPFNSQFSFKTEMHALDQKDYFARDLNVWDTNNDGDIDFEEVISDINVAMY